MKSVTWKNIGIVIAAVVGLSTLSGMALPVLRSDPPPWASIKTVGEAAQMVRDSIKDLKIDMLTARIFNYRREQCTAIRRGDMRLASTIGDQIRRSASEYYDLTDREFDLRPCDEF